MEISNELIEPFRAHAAENTAAGATEELAPLGSNSGLSSPNVGGKNSLLFLLKIIFISIFKKNSHFLSEF